MDGWITIGTELETKQFDKQILELERKINDLEKIINSPKDIGLSPSDIQDAELELEKTKNKLIQIKDQQKKINQEAQKNALGNSFSDALKKVGRLTLGIFGVRSAYLGIRQAVSTLSQYNDDLANKIQAIKLALISTIEPVINFIVGVVSKVVSFIGYILKMLFGIDIFARATALSFGKINAGASGATKSVKEMRKQLAGFDEINVLNENGTTGLAGGLGNIGGIANQLKDLDKQGEKVFKSFRKWFLGSDKNSFKGILEDNIKLFKNHWEMMSTTLKNVASVIFKPLRDAFGFTMESLRPIIEPVKRELGKMIQDVKPIWNDTVNNYLKPLWKNFVNYMKPNVIDPFINTFKPIGTQIYNMLVPIVNNIIDLINNAFGVFGVNLKHWEYQTEETGEKVGDNLTEPLNDVQKEVQDINKQKINIKASTGQLNTVQTKLSDIWSTLKNIIKKPWDVTFRMALGGGLSSFGFAGGGGYRAKGGIFYPSKLPRLASGGIINQPGRGVPYNGAIIGERGAEAVVPLTDRQQMELLGQTIGKYITINATVVNTMNGRVISRELKQVENEQNFAFNT